MFSADCSDFMLRLAEEGVDLFGVGKQLPACRGQRDPGAASVEKLHTKVLFECLDLKTDGGLRQVKLLRSLAEAQLMCDGSKHHHTEVFETCHGGIRSFMSALLPFDSPECRLSHSELDVNLWLREQGVMNQAEMN